MAKVVLKNVRLAFANIWEAKPFQPGATPKYNGAFLFDPKSENAKAVEEVIKAVAKEKWPAKWESVLAEIKGNPNKFCFRNGNTKPDYDGYPGNLFVSASTDTRPDIRDRDGKTPLTKDDRRPYGGCYVNAVLDIWPQDNQYGKGIQAKMLAIQFVNDGDAFSGGASVSEDDFEDLSDGSDAPNLGATGTGGGFV